MKSSDMKSSKGGARGGAGMSAKAEQVKAAQQALKDQGLDPGPIDGKMGPKTKAALRDYQQKQGLKATGRLDTETASKLGVEKTSAGSSSTSPAASPSTSAPSSSDTKAKSTDSKK
jgi:peptidoglycan hydrolase-like protein with peptidoglycan-binding domain